MKSATSLKLLSWYKAWEAITLRRKDTSSNLVLDLYEATQKQKRRKANKPWIKSISLKNKYTVKGLDKSYEFDFRPSKYTVYIQEAE